ncbi:hypothetical protein NDU88_002137 [Pleurodeles waltl]|uniref:Uncharacterized protein n=1 Tax=Pleurodeles waltl TaxID=8319 RepID=A0AAV7P941_PLEWA|nr:hypothetical protein NDU88_002137 [Pleurodeles waltl]
MSEGRGRERGEKQEEGENQKDDEVQEEDGTEEEGEEEESKHEDRMERDGKQEDHRRDQRKPTQNADCGGGGGCHNSDGKKEMGEEATHVPRGTCLSQVCVVIVLVV